MLKLVASTATHCPYCSLQCGMYLTIDEGGPAVAPRDFPTRKAGPLPICWPTPSG